MVDREVHKGLPSEPVTTVSWTITAALPLSNTSAIRDRATALPATGIGWCATISCFPCSTFARSISTPGNETAGGSKVRRFAATVANVGSTRRSRS
jgi:hypothetical protein